ncbi:MAG: hypothetical protein AAF289_11435 [Cyanobacteria bacterium P01_A01_bin.135]
MTALQFFTLSVPLQPAPTLRERIEAALRQQGQPLRWAITATENGAAVVEAVICCD